MKKIIDKEILRSVINESIESFLLEGIRDQMSFGIKGPIPVEPASSLCDDVNPDVLSMVDSGQRGIPRGMIGSPKYFGGTKIWDAYMKYSNAITRRADLGRSAVSFFVFLKKTRMGWKGAPLQVYESNGNYLIGTMRNGVFLCIYFCPQNASIGMFKFIKEICEFNNVVFAVTDDLANMLERIGCPKYDDTINAKFRGKMHEKMVYGSTKEAVEKGAELLTLMGKSSEAGDVLKNALQENPKLKELYDNNPQIVYKIINEPIITKCLMNNPQLIDIIIKNPYVIQQIMINPIKGFFNFLIKYRANRMATNSINEDKNDKK